jgi:hypothetical protein
MIEITEYWNKVVDDPTQPFGTRVTPEYEIKATFRVNNTLADLKSRWRGHKNITIKKDMIVDDRGKSYGIHSYAEIREV